MRGVVSLSATAVVGAIIIAFRPPKTFPGHFVNGFLILIPIKSFGKPFGHRSVFLFYFDSRVISTVN